MTDAGSLPRLLTLNPFSRAQARTSAFSDEPIDRTCVPCLDGRPLAPAARATCCGLLAADGFLLRVCLPPERPELLLLAVAVSCFPETTSSTSYNAPTTRIASSSGSLESRVSFKACAFRCCRGWRIGGQPPRTRNATSPEPLTGNQRSVRCRFAERWVRQLGPGRLRSSRPDRGVGDRRPSEPGERCNAYSMLGS
jgi:hypothetical protein